MIMIIITLMMMAMILTAVVITMLFVLAMRVLIDDGGGRGGPSGDGVDLGGEGAIDGIICGSEVDDGGEGHGAAVLRGVVYGPLVGGGEGAWAVGWLRCVRGDGL